MSPASKWRHDILAALKHLGSSTVAEIAELTKMDASSVSERLRTMEGEDLVHTSGRAAGGRGPAPNLWALGAAAAAAATGTGRAMKATTAAAPTPPAAAGLVERADLDAALTQKREADRLRREAEQRADRAERDLAGTAERLRAAAADAQEAQLKVQEQEQEIAELLQADQLLESGAEVTSNGAALVLGELAEDDTRRIDFEHRVKMRERYFDTLLSMVGHEGGATPDVLDRIEALIDGDGAK